VDEVRALGGIVDYTVGPSNVKVFCLAEHPDPKHRTYLNLYKLGDRPLYPFWIPYHLPTFEAPNAIARVVLLGDGLAPPLGGPVVEVCAVAKRDLKAGETFDDHGMFMTSGEAVNVHEMSAGRYCPRASSTGDACSGTSSRAPWFATTTSSSPQADSPTGSAPISTATSAARAGSKSALRRGLSRAAVRRGQSGTQPR
jgi:hypothetical protein